MSYNRIQQKRSGNAQKKPGYKPGGHSLAAGVKGARTISEAPLMHVSNLEHHERVSSYDSVESNTSNASYGARSNVSSAPSSSPPTVGPIGTMPVLSPRLPRAPSKLQHIDSSSRENSRYNPSEVASMVRQSYTNRNEEYLSDDFTNEFDNRCVIPMNKLQNKENLDGMIEVDAKLPENKIINIAPSKPVALSYSKPEKRPDPVEPKPKINIKPVSAKEPEETVKLCKARYTFQAAGPRELSFKKKDIIKIRREVDANWLEGELNGQVGIFPTNYVEILEDKPLDSPPLPPPPPPVKSPEKKSQESETTFGARTNTYVPSYQRDVNSLPQSRYRLKNNAENKADELKRKLDEQLKKEDEERRQQEEKELREEQRKLEEEKARLEEERRRLDELRKEQEEEQRRAERKRRKEEEDKRRREEEAEAKRKEEERRRREEEERKAIEEAKRREEQKRLEDARKRAEEKRRREEEERKKREEEEKKKREEEQRRIEERRKIEEERRRIEEERKRIEEERRKKEERLAAEARRRAAEEERKRQEERKEAERRKAAEEERKRQEERKEAERRKVAEEERKRVEEERKRVEEERKRVEEERKRKAEERKRVEEEARLEDERLFREEEEKREEERRKREDERRKELERLNNENTYRVSHDSNVHVVESTINDKSDYFDVEAKYSFKSQTDSELSFKKGTVITVTDVVDENWYFGKIGSREGMFPVSYVDKIPTPSHKMPEYIEQVQRNEPYPEYTQNSFYDKNDNGYDDKAADDDDQSSDSSIFQEYELYIAKYEYEPKNSDELQLHRGDIIEVIERCDDGWYVGTSQRTELFGTFPGNYVAPYEDP